MPTLYVENVPEDLYEALRKRARQNRTSISAEVIEALTQMVPTEEELARRAEFLKFALKAQSRKPRGRGPFPTAEEMVSEDRER